MWWLFLYLLTGTLLTCGAQEYYVTPTPPPNTNCPSHKPCHTLDYYARNAFDLINGRENVSLLFLSGYHNSETVFEIANVDVLTIAGYGFNFQNPSATIGLTRMLISNGTVFTLKNIAISYTTLNVSDFQSTKNYAIFCEASLISLRSLQVDSILLTHSRLHQCQWLIYWGYTREIGFFDPVETSAIGISTISDTTPSVEISNTDVYSESSINMRSARSGNTSVNLNVSFCSFLDTNGLIITALTVGEHLSGSELVIRMDHCSMTDDLVGIFINANNTHNVHLEISDLNFTAIKNETKTVQLVSTGSTINATVENSNFLGGIGLEITVSGPSILSLAVRACTFMRASSDSIRIITYEGDINALIEDCQFVDGFNSDPELLLYDRVMIVWALISPDVPQIVLRNVLIKNNHFVTGIVHLLGPIHMTIDNCTFEDNSAIISGGLLSFFSNITFTGNTIFENNTGVVGGAIYLYESQLMFADNLSLTFSNNKVDLSGGAIFISETGSPAYRDGVIQFIVNPAPKCFYQLETDITNNSTLPSINFINNTAQSGGDNIYGAALKDACTVTPNKLKESYEIQNSLFNFHPMSQFSVSSSPRRVCLCDSVEPKCADMEYIFINKSVAPGERLSVDVILVGFDFGPTTGGVFATELTENNNGATVLKPGEEIQLLATNRNCTTVHYSVSGDINSTTEIILTSSRLNADAIIHSRNMHFTQKEIAKSIEHYHESGVVRTNLLYTPIFATFNFLPCPIGLEIDNKNETCICSNELISQNIVNECFVQNNRPLINRTIDQRAWFRIYGDTNDSLVFEYSRICLYGYCNTTKLTIDPSNPDSQCTNNRSGVLCGGCTEGFSLAIGSVRCLECPDNVRVSLTLLFLLLGVLLVLFIWILDLTISRGTINGLLFYVNMVSIHRNIFFIENTDLSETFNNCLQAAKVFIDWCNLDFGIESCFIYGLNATGKIWLQFLFPLYVWSLAGLIIVACKYSTRLTKLFGNNSVSVLLTLFLIAYMKIVRTINATFSFATIPHLNSGLSRTVWLVDGNVNYQDASHIVLCLVSGIVTAFLFSFTIWLLLIKWTKKLPQHHKINPILDSYTGPLKVNHEYWIGLSLITRVCFAIGVILFSQGTAILQFLTFFMFIFGIVVSHVYKKIYLSLLEIVFMMNLLLLSSVFIQATDNALLATTLSVSVLISALMFVGICIYHGVKFVKRICPKVAKYLRERRKTKQKIEEATNEQANKTPSLTVVNLNVVDNDISASETKNVRTVASYSNYREELLDSTEL